MRVLFLSRLRVPEVVLGGPTKVMFGTILQVLDVDDKGLPAGAELGASDIAHDGDGGLAEAGGHDLAGAGEEPVLVPDFDNVGSFAHWGGLF